MSSCVRSVLNKFASRVNTHRQVTKSDYQLFKHVKSCLFLEQFLGMQTRLNAAVISTNAVISLSRQNVPITSFNVRTEKPKTTNKSYSYNKRQAAALKQQSEKSIQVLNLSNVGLRNISMLENKIEDVGSSMVPETKHFDFSHAKAVFSNRIFHSTLPSSKTKGVSNSNISPSIQDIKENQPEDHKTSHTKLEYVFKCLERDLPNLFVSNMDYSIYTEDVVFVNNLKGSVTTGLKAYIGNIVLLRVVGHLKYAHISFKILKMTMHPEDSSVKVRWRIEGISGLRVFYAFWTFNLFRLREQASTSPAWYDGFSTFYVNNDGKIFKHVVDKLMPDQEQEKANPIASKLALFTSLSPDFDQSYLNVYPELLKIK